MANKYYSLDTSDFSKWIISVASSLADKYGEGVTIHKQSTTDIVFSCDAISEKAIKIVNGYAYYGSVSGDTFTSESMFLYADGGLLRVKHLVLGDSFFFLVGESSYRALMLVAKTICGFSIIIGGSSSSNSNYNVNCKWHSYKDGAYIGTVDFVNFGRTCYCAVGVPYKTPLMLINTSSQGDYVMRQPDGTLDTIEGLWQSTHNPNASYLTVGALFSPVNLYKSDNKQHLRTALLAEF